MLAERIQLIRSFIRPTRFVVLPITVVIAVMLSPAVRGAAQQPVCPQLAKALVNPGHPSWREDGRLAVWVYFKERGLTPSQLETALERAEASLPDDVARRRGPASPPRLARLLGVIPNPFNARTVVRAEMARAGTARLDVYDVQGRLVRRLSNGRQELAAGLHDFARDGRNERGRKVGGGVYLIRLFAGGVAECGKLALIR